MRAERLSGLLHPIVIAALWDDGLGGYQDTEALGVIGARPASPEGCSVDYVTLVSGCVVRSVRPVVGRGDARVG